MGTWYDAGYVIEKYNEHAGSTSNHYKIAEEFRKMFINAERAIEKQDREFALAKEKRERIKAQREAEEPEMMC